MHAALLLQRFRGSVEEAERLSDPKVVNDYKKNQRTAHVQGPWPDSAKEHRDLGADGGLG